MDPTHFGVSRPIINVIGIAGMVVGLLYRVPQIYRTYKRKSAIDISVWMIFIQNLSYVFYIIYGVLVWDWIVISSSIISVLQNFIIIWMRFKFAKPSVQIETIDLEKNTETQPTK